MQTPLRSLTGIFTEPRDLLVTVVAECYQERRHISVSWISKVPSSVLLYRRKFHCKSAIWNLRRIIRRIEISSTYDLAGYLKTAEVNRKKHTGNEAHKMDGSAVDHWEEETPESLCPPPYWYSGQRSSRRTGIKIRQAAVKDWTSGRYHMNVEHAECVLIPCRSGSGSQISGLKLPARHPHQTSLTNLKQILPRDDVSSSGEHRMVEELQAWCSNYGFVLPRYSVVHEQGPNCLKNQSWWMSGRRRVDGQIRRYLWNDRPVPGCLAQLQTTISTSYALTLLKGSKVLFLNQKRKGRYQSWLMARYPVRRGAQATVDDLWWEERRRYNSTRRNEVGNVMVGKVGKQLGGPLPCHLTSVQFAFWRNTVNYQKSYWSTIPIRCIMCYSCDERARARDLHSGNLIESEALQELDPLPPVLIFLCLTSLSIHMRYFYLRSSLPRLDRYFGKCSQVNSRSTSLADPYPGTILLEAERRYSRVLGKTGVCWVALLTSKLAVSLHPERVRYGGMDGSDLGDAATGGNLPVRHFFNIGDHKEVI
ncbi:hypothetical protein EDD18DRAFT_1098535 [Armillaria luteobubalina]|uniref:Uncharacterized protein n=1 Tax=Armillaria luteobubalina TaxID=153913 RepID=A0AA39UVI4_9AGAR|nr:hypothetical protein EDD18DRAFT_1098535 [Armillaria luteobubalina]